MRKRAAGIVWAALALSSCREPALEYPPPEQRPALEDYKAPAARVVNMDDGDVMQRAVRDLSAVAAANWRWTGERPAVRVRVRSNENLKYVIDFTLPELTFKDTGPVTVTFTVNDHVLGRARYTSSGTRHFEKTVPPDWVEVGKDATVGAEVDKVWVSKDDGARFGMILTRIGLTQ